MDGTWTVAIQSLLKTDPSVSGKRFIRLNSGTMRSIGSVTEKTNVISLCRAIIEHRSMDRAVATNPLLRVAFKEVRTGM
eukprot:CAMPEP_0202504224 /NCGR_PEP_ID=MMETSP1361-20130828/43973_1 /ASSEMBLY_ACC=CAM_ASM_000849 /TAXON_ID=210615 /ORGANISM="Staurosira complex sp., Strain CCMP2646" /LENGTH=78 /DNA_ID=CAMNT_0049137681 /DNA_START=327 /DNA_END=563 /DNA_ORIENTATION=-